MYVCAIPVGHPVTARIFFVASEIVGIASSCFASPFSALSMILRNSSTVFADFNAFVKSSSIRSTDNLLSTSRWTLSAVSGAAIRNSRCTGSPSNESKSTPSGITIAARPACFTAADLQCGIAIPSPIPVVPSCSLAYTPLRYVSTSAIFPLSAIKATARSSVSSFELTFAPR